VDEARERDRLFQADRHILELHVHIGKQQALVERLNRMGRPAEVAQSLLETLEGSLRVFQRHRELILAALDRGP
jgi:hypothetical protein